jgi:hypothetical protein
MSIGLDTLTILTVQKNAVIRIIRSNLGAFC